MVTLFGTGSFCFCVLIEWCGLVVWFVCWIYLVFVGNDLWLVVCVD